MKKYAAVLLGLTLLIVGCGSEDVASVPVSGASNGNIRVLAGASASAGTLVTSAKISVVQVRLVRAGSAEEVELSNGQDEIELRSLCSGATKSIAESSIPEGDYDGLHIVISAASLDLDDKSHFDFEVPDDGERDLLIHLPHKVRIDSSHYSDIQLDIDLDKTFAEQPGCPSGAHPVVFKPAVTPVMSPAA